MSEEENTFDDWKARFETLQNEATEYGIATIVILNQEDLLARSESIAFSHRGSIIRLLGMMDHTLRALQKLSS